MPDAQHLPDPAWPVRGKTRIRPGGGLSPCVPASVCAGQTYVEDQAAAEDVLQECFVSIWRQAGQYQATQSQPMTWMTRIVRNRCIDRLRRPDVVVPDPDDTLTLAMADDSPGPLARLQSNQEGRRLADCMGELEGPQRVAIAMAFLTTWRIPTSRRAWTRRWER